MLLDNLIQKTEIFIDEASAVTTSIGSLSSSKKPLKTQIEESLNNAFRPLYIDVNPLRVHCSLLSYTLSINDNIGTLSFSEEFIRFKLLKMKGWDRPVDTLSEIGSAEYKRQQNIYSRAGQSRPVVTFNGVGLTKYKDWHLPTLEELAYFGLSNARSFDSVLYWSSDDDIEVAFSLDGEGDLQDEGIESIKSEEYRVCAMRSQQYVFGDEIGSNKYGGIIYRVTETTTHIVSSSDLGQFTWDNAILECNNYQTSEEGTQLYLYTIKDVNDIVEDFEIIWNWGIENVQDDLVDALCWGAARYYFSIIAGVNVPEMVIANYNSQLL